MSLGHIVPETPGNALIDRGEGSVSHDERPSDCVTTTSQYSATSNASVESNGQSPAQQRVRNPSVSNEGSVKMVAPSNNPTNRTRKDSQVAVNKVAPLNMQSGGFVNENF